jgi:SAM-dependent methyltransferase
VDDKEVGRYWEGNAEAWTFLARKGYDIYRDHFNTPGFLSILPDVAGLCGLDIGCGEGYNTRRLAARGARMKAVDIAPTFIRHAQEEESNRPLGIDYSVANAVELPFPDSSFDFATAFMSIMDMADSEKAIREAYRVVKQGGFFQFSICHPCFTSSKNTWVDDEQGCHVAMAVSDYFKEGEGEIIEWTFHEAPSELKRTLPKFRTPTFHRTLSGWLNLLLDSGFVIERVLEPKASNETIEEFPELADTRLISHFLILRCRKS